MVVFLVHEEIATLICFRGPYGTYIGFRARTIRPLPRSVCSGEDPRGEHTW